MTVVRYYRNKRTITTRIFSCRFFLLLVFILLLDTIVLFVDGRKKRKDGHPLSRSVRLLNQSGLKIDIYWIHPQTKELAPSNTNGEGIMYGGETGIASYVGHRFLIQELPNERTNACRDNNICKQAYFQVNDNEDQWVTVGKDLKEIIHEDNKTRAMEKAREVLLKCQQQIIEDKNNNLITTTTTKDDAIQQIDLLTECYQREIQKKLNETQNEILFQSTVRKDMGYKLSQYVCSQNANLPISTNSNNKNNNMTTTESIRNVTWSYQLPLQPKHKKQQKQKHKQQIELPKSITKDVHILFETDYSSIRLIKQFTTPMECSKIVQESKAFVSNSDNNHNQTTTTTTILQIPSVTKHDSIVPEFLYKVNMLLSAFLQLPHNYYVTTKTTKNKKEIKQDNNNNEEMNPAMKIHIISETSSSSSSQARKSMDYNNECELNTDGSCIQNTPLTTRSTSATDSDNDSHNNNIRYTNIDHTTIANLIIICQAPTPSSSSGGHHRKNSGMLYFPKTGVRISPQEVIGDAILLLHQQSQQQKHTSSTSQTQLLRDPDPFLDEYITCPVFANDNDKDDESNHDPKASSSSNHNNNKNQLVTIEDFYP